jgi:nucleoside-diphosphate-sugar epimerase
MVIGNGLIANKFLPKYSTQNNTIIFASGVSNSKSIDQNEFEREYNLVAQTLRDNPAKCFIYFSTCSVYDAEESTSQYVIHKKKIEELVTESANPFYIFRVSNLVGSTTNKNTILNYLFSTIQNNMPFNLWINASRNLIGVDDMYAIIDEIINTKIYLNSTINIANTNNYKVKDIVQEIETFCSKKANFIQVGKGHTYLIDTTLIQPILQKLNINFPQNYLAILLQKYYTN